MTPLRALWTHPYRPILAALACLTLAIWLGLAWQEIFPQATPTPSPTDPPYPTPTPVSFHLLLKAIYERIQIDDTIPAPGKKPVISLIGGEPTFVFPNNAGLVLQYNLFELPNDPEVVKKTTLLLIQTGVLVAREQDVPLDAVEVVFYAAKDRPWFAFISTPPWSTGQLMLVPLDPQYIEQLKKRGVITPTLETH